MQPLSSLITESCAGYGEKKLQRKCIQIQMLIGGIFVNSAHTIQILYRQWLFLSSANLIVLIYKMAENVDTHNNIVKPHFSSYSCHWMFALHHDLYNKVGYSKWLNFLEDFDNINNFFCEKTVWNRLEVKWQYFIQILKHAWRGS